MSPQNRCWRGFQNGAVLAMRRKPLFFIRKRDCAKKVFAQIHGKKPVPF
jgi:hypothetical protein